MAENQFFIDSDKLSEAALERKHKLETDPSSRTNHMEYMPGMEQIDPTIRNKVLSDMDSPAPEVPDFASIINVSGSISPAFTSGYAVRMEQVV